MNKAFSVYTVALLVLAYAAYSVIRISTSFAPDFSVFYESARGLVARENIYALPMYTGLGYPPFTLLPFIPFTWIQYPVAQAVWILCSFMLFLYGIYLSLSRPTLLQYCIVFTLSFLAFPTKFTLGMGQVNFAALALLLLAVRYNSGLLLGLLFIIKPHFLLFLPLFKPRTIGVSLLTLGLGIVTTGYAFGWNEFRAYFGTVSQLLVFTGREIYYNQSLGSFLARTLPRALAADLTFWISALLVVGGLWFIWYKRLRLLESVLLFLPIFLLVEPLSWQHHYIFLLPVYVWLISKKKHMILVLLSYLLVAINIPYAPNILLSHVFFGNLIVLGLMVYETAN